MVNTWEMVLQEVHPQAIELVQSGSRSRGTIEFLTDSMLTPDELVSQARAIIEQNFYVLEATVYKPAGVNVSRRWLATVVLRPIVEVNIVAQTEALGENLHTAGLLYRAQKEWFWDTAADILSTISGLIQLMVVMVIMSIMTPMMSGFSED